MFSSGEYSIGRIVKKPVINFGYPVKNTTNEVIAVLSVVLDLDYSQHMFETLIVNDHLFRVRSAVNDVPPLLFAQSFRHNHANPVETTRCPPIPCISRSNV